MAIGRRSTKAMTKDVNFVELEMGIGKREEDIKFNKGSIIHVELERKRRWPQR